MQRVLVTLSLMCLLVGCTVSTTQFKSSDDIYIKNLDKTIFTFMTDLRNKDQFNKNHFIICPVAYLAFRVWNNELYAIYYYGIPEPRVDPVHPHAHDGLDLKKQWGKILGDYDHNKWDDRYVLCSVNGNTIAGVGKEYFLEGHIGKELPFMVTFVPGENMGYATIIGKENIPIYKVPQGYVQ